MSVPDISGFYMYIFTYSVYMMFFNLHHSETQIFKVNVDTVWEPKIRQLHSPGGYMSAMSSQKDRCKGPQNGCGADLNI